MTMDSISYADRSSSAKQLFSNFRHHRFGHGATDDASDGAADDEFSFFDSKNTTRSNSKVTTTFGTKTKTKTIIPHQGALRRMEGASDSWYAIEIAVDKDTHYLEYTRRDFEFANRLFAILDTESRGLVDRLTVKEFVTQRCPVFWRRDDDLRRSARTSQATTMIEADSPTFDEIWNSVTICSQALGKPNGRNQKSIEARQIGVEGWIVFCRFVALAQYLEAKRRFSARHLQQTMRHRNAPRGSELVVVDVPPLEPPAPLTPEQLASHERKIQSPLPLPELDLDHILLAAHDSIRGRGKRRDSGRVKISVFSTTSSQQSSFTSNFIPSASTSNASNLEFAVTFVRWSAQDPNTTEELVVRRSMSDMKWLNDTFSSHKVLGGTLCGRILPPFPNLASGSMVSVGSFAKSEDFQTTLSSTTGGAITAAAASVGRFRDAARSFLGTYLNASVSGLLSVEDPPAPTVKKLIVKQRSLGKSLPDGYYNPNSPSGKARQVERYLNYLLEHPALSASFPLNAILKASQCGIDAAKVSLDECTRASKEMNEQSPQLSDGKMSIPFWPTSSGSNGLPASTPNFAWVRTAAQAAMALRVHGMLETTGMQSASARLQHASLPAFGCPVRGSGWGDDESDLQAQVAEYHQHRERSKTDLRDPREEANFEDGVVSVVSELQYDEHTPDVDDGYDLLPLPVPAPERTILSAGSSGIPSHMCGRETRFHYGSGGLQGLLSLDDDDDASSAFVGGVSVDDNIDKLREVIGSVDNTLSRCLASSGVIGKARKECQSLHLDVLRGLDSWAGMRGKFVSQRSLMKGVEGIQQSRDVFEESGLALVDVLSWQTALAHSAVSAAEDVRSAVRAARTASSAKAAARSAALAAQGVCSSGKFSTMDDARAAQTRASIAQSHAIHAAVVDHEAKTVKRRATLALAHDVKCWNVHRRREMLRSCMLYARSQHEATRRAVDAWSSLRDGFIGTTIIPSTHHDSSRRRSIPCTRRPSRGRELSRLIITDPDEVTARIFNDDFDDEDYGTGENQSRMIVAVEHHLLHSPMCSDTPTPTSTSESLAAATGVVDTSMATMSSTDEVDVGLDKSPTRGELEFALPFASAAPIPEEEDEEEKGADSEFFFQIGTAPTTQYMSNLDPLVSCADTGNFNVAVGNSSSSRRSSSSIAHVGGDNGGAIRGGGEEILSASMQSLVDGLMSWGGGFEAEEDHFALPAGMAASIALEGSSPHLGS